MHQYFQEYLNSNEIDQIIGELTSDKTKWNSYYKTLNDKQIFDLVYFLLNISGKLN